MADDDDGFIGRCLIEGFAWRRNANRQQPWSAVRRSVPIDSAAAIGTRFRHCSAPLMLKLLANRIELLFDDDDDDEDDGDDENGDDSDSFVAVYCYLRDYRTVNQVELSFKQLQAIDYTMNHLESLSLEVAEMKREAAFNDDTKIISGAVQRSDAVLDTEAHDYATVTSSASNDLPKPQPENFVNLKKENRSPVRPHQFSEGIVSEEDDEWDDDEEDAGWAAVTSLSAPKQREIVLSDEQLTVLLNRDVEVQPDSINLHMASIFPLNDLPSDSDDDDSVFEDPNRQFAPEWNAVAFLADGICSDPSRLIPKQGSEFEKRPLGDMFHENDLGDDTSSSSNNHSGRLRPLVNAPRTPSEQATPLLVRDTQQQYLLFERTATIPKIELSAPYRPWRQIRDELYANTPAPIVDAAYGSYDAALGSELDMEDANGPPAIISVPMNMDPAPVLLVPAPIAVKPAVVQPTRRCKSRSLPRATLHLIKVHILKALRTYPDLASSAAPIVDVKQQKPSQQPTRVEVKLASQPAPVQSQQPVRPAAAPPALSKNPLSLPPAAQNDVKPIIAQPAAQVPAQQASSSSKADGNNSTSSSKPPAPMSRLLAANPISIDASLRAGHNYLQILMTWVQRNFSPQVVKPSETIRVDTRGDAFLATFELKTDPPLLMQTVSHAATKKAAKHEVARQAVLFIQKRKLGDAVKFNQRRVDSRADKMALSAVASGADDDSDSASSMDIENAPIPPAVSYGSVAPIQAVSSHPGLPAPPPHSLPDPQTGPQPGPPTAAAPIRIKMEPRVTRDPVTPPWRNDFEHLEPPPKRTRNESVAVAGFSQVQPAFGLVPQATAASMSARQSSIKMAPNYANGCAPVSSALIDCTILQREAMNSGTDPCKVLASVPSVKAIFAPKDGGVAAVPIAAESDVPQPVDLSNGYRTRNLDIGLLVSSDVPPLVSFTTSLRAASSPSGFENEARRFLDNLSPHQPSLCVAKEPGDPFVIYLDEESFGDDPELELNQMKLNSIKSELLLLKEKIARAEAMKGLQKRDGSSS